MNAVARNRVIEEAILREQRSLRLATDYRVPDASKSELQCHATPARPCATGWQQHARRARAAAVCMHASDAPAAAAPSHVPAHAAAAVLPSPAVVILPDKPNHTIPAQQPSKQQLQAAQDKLAALTCIRHIGCAPAQAYALPITANMEYGFTEAPLVWLAAA